jgi:hypothetical protein
VTKIDIGGAVGVYQYPAKTTKGSTETLWLVNHASDGSPIETPAYTAETLDVCWSTEATVPAVIVSTLYKSSGAYKVARATFDPDATRAATNKFGQPAGTTGGCGVNSGTTYKQQLDFGLFSPPIDPAVDTLISLSLTPLYSDTTFAVLTPVALPLQGGRVESSGSTTAGIARKIVVYQLYRTPPSIFDAAVVSGSNFGR